MEENEIIRAPQYQYARERYYNELWYTIPYHLQPNNTRNTVLAHIYVRPKKDKKGHFLAKTFQTGGAPQTLQLFYGEAE